MEIRVRPSDYESSHKFGHNPLTEALWVCSLDSDQDDQAGTVDDIGWHALFHFESDEDVEIQGGPYDNPTVEATVTVPRGSYILVENDQGFVYVDSYPYKSEEVEKDWLNIQEHDWRFWQDEEDNED